jgi:hypothetical protein
MTQAEWLACDDLRPMLNFVRESISERKMLTGDYNSLPAAIRIPSPKAADGD